MENKEKLAQQRKSKFKILFVLRRNDMILKCIEQRRGKQDTARGLVLKMK